MIPQYPLEMYQGATFRRTFNWYGGGVVRAAIEDVTPGFPTIVKVTGHGLPSVSPTPMVIDGVRGTVALNTKDCAASEATYVDIDTFSIPVNTIGKKWTSPSGGITWYMPSDMTDFTAKMEIRDKIGGIIIHTLTTDPSGGITLVSADGAINLEIDAADTALFDFTTAVYDIDVIDPSGVSTPVVGGTITLYKEVTT